MSGGHFEYNQFIFQEIAEEIQRIIDKNHELDEWGFGYDYNQETIQEFVKTIQLLKLAEIYVHRIDWLVSGDDGEDTFHERLKEDLEELHNS